MFEQHFPQISSNSDMFKKKRFVKLTWNDPGDHSQGWTSKQWILVQDIMDWTGCGINEVAQLTKDRITWSHCVHHVAKPVIVEGRCNSRNRTVTWNE